ncbi:hypothetical protein D3C75_883980 [compost metagenome]
MVGGDHIIMRFRLNIIDSSHSHGSSSISLRLSIPTLRLDLSNTFHRCSNLWILSRDIILFHAYQISGAWCAGTLDSKRHLNRCLFTLDKYPFYPGLRLLDDHLSACGLSGSCRAAGQEQRSTPNQFNGKIHIDKGVKRQVRPQHAGQGVGA